MYTTNSVKPGLHSMQKAVHFIECVPGLKDTPNSVKIFPFIIVKCKLLIIVIKNGT